MGSSRGGGVIRVHEVKPHVRPARMQRRMLSLTRELVKRFAWPRWKRRIALNLSFNFSQIQIMRQRNRFGVEMMAANYKHRIGRMGKRERGGECRALDHAGGQFKRGR